MPQDCRIGGCLVSTSMRGYLGPSASVSGPGRLRPPLLVPCRLRTVMVHEPVLSPHHAALDGIPISLETPAQVMESVDEAGERAAGVLSLIESAKPNGHDPWANPKDVFERLSTLEQPNLAHLLPHDWRPQGGLAAVDSTPATKTA